MTRPFRYRFYGQLAEEHHEARARIPAGDYSRLEVTFRVDAPTRQRKHLLLFAGKTPAPNQNPTRNLYCFAVADRRGRCLFRHGPRTKGGWKARPKVHLPGAPLDSTFTVQLVYDREQGVRLWVGGTASATDDARTSLTFDGRQELVLSFGFTGRVPLYEPRAKGWTYHDLEVKLT